VDRATLAADFSEIRAKLPDLPPITGAFVTERAVRKNLKNLN
jgi:hypothetical protein